MDSNVVFGKTSPIQFFNAFQMASLFQCWSFVPSSMSTGQSIVPWDPGKHIAFGKMFRCCGWCYATTHISVNQVVPESIRAAYGTIVCHLVSAKKKPRNYSDLYRQHVHEWTFTKQFVPSEIHT